MRLGKELRENDEITREVCQEKSDEIRERITRE